MTTATEQISATHGWSCDPDPDRALDEIFGPAGVAGASLGIVFASAETDLDALGRAMDERFSCPVIGCTSAGELCAGGYTRSGIAAAALRGVDARAAVIDDAQSFNEDRAMEIAHELGADTVSCADSAVLITVLDGLCTREEWISSRLYAATGGIPMIGGSSGDNLTFDRARVFTGERFERGKGVCALVRAGSGIRTFVAHDSEDTGRLLVVTGADPETRTIHEINGVPAARAYAQALGIDQSALTPEKMLVSPLMIRAGSRLYARSVREVLGDGSLRLYCAIDEGVVLHVGRPSGQGGGLDSVLESATTGMKPELVLAFDCVLRRCEAEQSGSHRAVRSAGSRFPLLGFSTYGEQYNGVHVNHTVTGVVFGEER